MANRQTKAIFTREFHWKRPHSPLGFGAKAKPEPQQFPEDFIQAAVKAGAATLVATDDKG
ncbi:hypothetical protein [Frigidibacter sp. MR17.24]|uniref:hypothetical protein n=1 Tax=Frigidibacter sp. MR17.24 TaxID=3127345 RepID=UPI0030130B34